MNSPLQTPELATGPAAVAGQPAIATARAEQPWPRPGEAWYAIAVFALALMLNFLDRGVISLLVQPIKRDLNLSDTQMGWLMGPAFVIFYVIMGLPIARLVDSRSRRTIIGVGVALWSFMTVLCGFARSFWGLFVCRIGVGVGEACNGPATFSMIADMFPRERLARAIAVLNFGFVAGLGIATLIGGAVIQAVSGSGAVSLPLVGELRPWQLTFIVVGLPGLALAGLFATIIEPPRRGRMHADSDAAPLRKAIPVREVGRFLARHKRAYAPMFLGLACQSIVSFGIQNWAATFFVRTYGWSTPRFAYTTGLLMLALSPIGLIPGSMFAEWLARRGYDDANLRVTALTLTLWVPAAIAFPLMPSAPLALAVMGVMFLLASFSIGPQNAALQIITPNEMRGQVTALFLFVFNTFGSGLAPLAVGLVTNYVVRSEARVGVSLALTAAVMGPLAMLIMWSGLKPYARAVAQARTWS